MTLSVPDGAADEAAPDAVPCSVNVLTHNSGRTLHSALSTVRHFAEIIVCDGRSTDDTTLIAKSHNAQIIPQDPRFCDASGRLLDYGGARTQMWRASTHPWILYLDSDELLAPEAVDVIRHAIAHTPARVGGYKLTALHVHGHTVIRNGSTYPYRHVRLYRREAVTGFSGRINEEPVFIDGTTVESLDATFYIPLPPLRTVLRKWRRYTALLYQEATQDTLTGVRRRQAVHRSSVRWLAKGFWRSFRTSTGPRMPLRYELARLVFAVAQWLAVVSAARRTASRHQ